MDVLEIIQRIDFLKTQIDELRPIQPDILNRINRKFRFDWSYHSSNIEGNSLTFGETKAFLLHGLTADRKPLRDHLEIRGHNEAILELEDIVSNNKPISELVIRQLHQMIFGTEPYKDEAFTPDGKNTHRTIYPGRYKSQPNYVTTTTGEQIDFTSPEDTAPKMQELIEWLRSELLKKEIHPLTLAASFHYRFIMIHPFDDGNGRIARLLMNLILMMNNFLPAIIHTEDKVNYLRALQQANIGDLDSFIIYVGEQLIGSLELFLKGAYGENIEDLDEVDKKIALFKAKLKKPEEGIKYIERSSEAINEILEKSFIPLLRFVSEKLHQFDDLFLKIEMIIKLKGEFFKINDHDINLLKADFPTENLEIQRRTLTETANNIADIIRHLSNMTYSIKDISFIEYTYSWRNFKSETPNTIFENSSLLIQFDEHYYSIRIQGNSNSTVSKFYYQQWNEKEILSFTNQIAESLLERFQKKLS